MISVLALAVCATATVPAMADSTLPHTATDTPVSATPAPVPAPASARTSRPSGIVNYLSPDTVTLSAKELHSLAITKDYAGGGPSPFIRDGKLTYTYGAGGVPTIIAAPMQVVDVELEPGETVNEIVVGDSARWLVETGTAGASTAGATATSSTHLFVKPLDTGLESSAVVTTDRRVYHLRLISKPKDFTPYVGFVYMADLKRQVAAQKADEAKKERWQSTTTANGSPTDLAHLNFSYGIKGDTPWKPERVYDDGKKTYIQFPPSVGTGEMPALLVKKGKKDVLVNYRVKGRVMEVDGLFETIALVVGVNGGLFNTGFGGEKQQLVEITRIRG